MALIQTKEEFYRLYNRGLLGNMLRNWTLAEWQAFDRAGQYPVDVIAARCTSRAGAPMNYNLKPQDALAWVRNACAQQGIAVTAYQFAECAPDHCNTLQGEVMRTEDYLYLRYVLHGHQRMRDSFNGSELHTQGLHALGMLKRWMDASSYDFLMDLLDRYPDAIVEFCCYPHHVGVLGWNTLFWEVRNY